MRQKGQGNCFWLIVKNKKGYLINQSSKETFKEVSAWVFNNYKSVCGRTRNQVNCGGVYQNMGVYIIENETNSK